MAGVLLSLDVDCHVHDNLRPAEVNQALKMALEGGQGNQLLVHHSDRGIQYCTHECWAVHHKRWLICSMTDGYGCDLF